MPRKDGTLDLRIRRTQKAIKESFFALLQEKEFEHISVKDITDKAMISRNTFYLHYSDKHDLLDKVCDDLMRTLFFRVGKQLRIVQRQKYTVESVASVIQKGITAVTDNREAYLILLSGSTQDVLTAKLQNMINALFDMVKRDIKNVPQYTTEFIISGMAGVVKYYIHHEPENLVEETINFTYLHMSGIINIANTLNKNEK